MKITDFYPIFYTKDVEAEIERYAKDLSFALKHRPEIEFLDYAVLKTRTAGVSILSVPISRPTLFPKDIWECGRM